MERIKKLLQNIITSAEIHGYDDVQFAAQTLLGSIENDIVDEFAQTCERFTHQKAEEIMFLQQVEQMIKQN